MAFLDNLSASQREAVVYNNGPHLIIAGAGSGKTRVLTYKIAYLLSEGVSAAHILALTFTNKAAREMRDRIGKLVGQDHSRYIQMGTFHSIFSRVLRQEADKLGYTSDYSIYDTTDSKSLIKQIVKEMDLDEKIYRTGDVLGRISEAKNNLISAREYANDRTYQTRDKISRMYRMADVYYYYQKRLREANAMDFDDLLCNMYLLLENFPEVKAKYQAIFQYILVDEYQDTNRVQYLIIKHLADKDKHICVVGDDAQSIYAFRGADIRNILEFQADYKGCPLFKLERNYRSTKNIVGAANSLIRHNIRQISKDVYSEKEEGLPIQISRHGSDRDEAQFLSQQARRLFFDGLAYDEMAVLYRTNAQSRVIEDEFRKLSIPYRIYGGLSFYQRKEIKDVLSYFRLICNPKDDEALLRIINFPARKIGETTMKRVKEVAHEQNVNLFEVVRHPVEMRLDVNGPTAKRLMAFAELIADLQQEVDTLDAYAFAQKVVTRSQIRMTMLADTTQEGQDKLQNVEELMSAIREYMVQQQESGAKEVSIRSFLSEVALLTDQDNQTAADDSRVTLMTVHSAKGLEFSAVMIAGMEENLFPSMFSESDKDLEEERRLFYVAITRAKDQCYITSADTRYKNGQLQFQSPSRFLRELDAQYVQRWQEPQRRTTNWESRGFEPIPSAPIPGRKTVSSSSHSDTNPLFSASHSDGTPFSSAPSAFSQPASKRLVPTTGMQVKGEKMTFDCPFPIGSRVRHATFGEGTVTDAYRENGNDKIIINFDASGTKTMILRFAKLTAL